MKMQLRPEEEGGTGMPNAEELLSAYARARGFATTGVGVPDESRAARYILKDYVRGKLLFCMPPPSDPPIDGQHFNRELYDFDHLPSKRQHAWIATQPGTDSLSVSESLADGDGDVDMTAAPRPGQKTQRMDKKFFGPGQSSAGHIARPFHYQYSEQGKELSGRKARTMLALERDVDPSEVRTSSKKHFKGNKRKVKAKEAPYE